MDLTALTGLRGIVAVWIMLHHVLLSSQLSAGLEGSSFMPLFFILSGLTLTIVYRSKKGSEEKDIEMKEWSEDHNNGIATSSVFLPYQTYAGLSTGNSQWVDTVTFLRNRLARVFPVYWLATVTTLPLWLLGYGSRSPVETSYLLTSLACSVVPIVTLTAFVGGYATSIDPPGWTISTLAVFWLFFPFTARRAQCHSEELLVSQIISNYWSQLIIMVFAFYVLSAFVSVEFAFNVSTMQPMIRFPCFVMGIYAGELIYRSQCASMLWPTSIFRFFPLPFLPSQDSDEGFWKSRADYQFAVLFALVSAISGFEGYARHVWKWRAGVVGTLWLQAIVPFIQLELIVSLIKEPSQSWAGRLLRTPLVTWLGKISLSLYLVHYPVIFYFLWYLNGYLPWPASLDCSNLPAMSTEAVQCLQEGMHFMEARTLPLWGIPVVISLSLLCGWMMFVYVEEPCRKRLRV